MAIGLTRRSASKLLSKVNGRQHATQADHHDTLPTPPASSEPSTRQNLSNEDIFADPESSDENNDDIRPSKLHIQGKPLLGGSGSEMVAEKNSSVRHNGRKTFLHSSSRSPGAKRDIDNASSDHDEAIFAGVRSQASQKRQKRTYSTFQNIHTLPQKSRGKPKKQAGSSTTSDKPKTKTFQFLENPLQKENIEKPRASFKRPEGIDIFTFGRLEEHDDTTATVTDPRSPSSSSLSPLPSSPEVEEIPNPQSPTVTCNICGDGVPKLLKEQFQDDVIGGHRMDFKWQQRFCRFHQAQTAREEWCRRNYPDIDWVCLMSRLGDHDAHLSKILTRKVSSTFAGGMAQRVKRRKSGKPGGNVGYYGPRGERLMVDHILSHFDDDLRSHAAASHLAASRGTAGGVSELVTTVLASELALQLIKEDMGIGDEQAKEVMMVSESLGELLHPEMEEQVEVHWDNDWETTQNGDDS